MAPMLELHNIDVQSFLSVLDTCEGDVFLVTRDGDHLNLKSKLCQLVGLTKLIEGGKISDAYIICSKPEGLKAKETPAILLQNEYMRRMNDMNTLYGGIFGGSTEAKETLVINTTNDIIKTLPTLSEENRTLVCKHILDLATISQRKLTADELKDFVARSVEILGIIK